LQAAKETRGIIVRESIKKGLLSKLRKVSAIFFAFALVSSVNVVIFATSETDLTDTNTGVTVSEDMLDNDESVSEETAAEISGEVTSGDDGETVQEGELSENSELSDELDEPIKIEKLELMLFSEEFNEAQLKEAIENAGSESTTITISNDIELSDVITISSGKNIVLTGSGAITLSGNFRHFIVNGELTLSGNVTLKGISPAQGGGVQVNFGGTFNMAGGEIRDNYTNASGGGINVGSGGTFNMTGGKISGNTAELLASGWPGESGNGGGVFIEPYADFNMRGGTIQDNSAIGGNGGGVMLMARSIVAMSDSQATAVISGSAKILNNKTEMKTFSGNVFGGNGGGIYATTVNAISVIENTVKFSGNSAIAAFDHGIENRGIDPWWIDWHDENSLPGTHVMNNYDVNYNENPIFCITFLANGGNGVMASQIARPGEKLTLMQNSFTRQNHNFVNWNTTSNGSGTTCGNRQVFEPWRIESNLTLYAQWQESRDPGTLTPEVPPVTPPGGGGEPDPEEPTNPEEPSDPLAPEVPPVRPPGGGGDNELVSNGNGGYIEVNEAGVPLGEWTWDENDGIWVFKEFPVPLKFLNIPQTGLASVKLYVLMFMMTVSAAGMAAILNNRKKERCS